MSAEFVLRPLTCLFVWETIISAPVSADAVAPCGSAGRRPIAQQGSGTHTGAGLRRFRRDAMRESQGFRPDVKTVIIVLTGGDTEDIELAVSESAAIMATGVSGLSTHHSSSSQSCQPSSHAARIYPAPTPFPWPLLRLIVHLPPLPPTRHCSRQSSPIG